MSLCIGGGEAVTFFSDAVEGFQFGGFYDTVGQNHAVKDDETGF